MPIRRVGPYSLDNMFRLHSALDLARFEVAA